MDENTLDIKASILTTTHNRNDLLKKHLGSINSQNVSFNYEILVLDDYYKSEPETIDIVNSFKYTRYIHTGKTKKEKDCWRVPGYALNIGAKLAKADILTITGCDIELIGPEVYQAVINTIEKSRDLITVKKIHVLNEDPRMRTAIRMPFFMTIPKETFMYIGGYDEDFIGVAAEDNDLMDRLMSLKKLVVAPVEIIHHSHENVVWDERRDYNLKLWKERKGILVRNVNKEWGFFPCK